MFFNPIFKPYFKEKLSLKVPASNHVKNKVFGRSVLLWEKKMLPLISWSGPEFFINVHNRLTTFFKTWNLNVWMAKIVLGVCIFFKKTSICQQQQQQQQQQQKLYQKYQNIRSNTLQVYKEIIK